MNLPELLKIAEAAGTIPTADEWKAYEDAITPWSVRDLIKRLQEAEKDARIAKWIIENSSVGDGIANCHSSARAAKFIRFPLIEGNTVEGAIIAAMNGGKE